MPSIGVFVIDNGERVKDNFEGFIVPSDRSGLEKDEIYVSGACIAMGEGLAFSERNFLRKTMLCVPDSIEPSLGDSFSLVMMAIWLTDALSRSCRALGHTTPQVRYNRIRCKHASWG